jgi:hypothetical protein
MTTTGQLLDAVPTRVHLSGPGEAGREEVETFIRARFAEAWGADVRHFLPALMSLRDEAGGLLGALGLRPAAQGPLFLEQYLDRPVEQALARATGEPVARTRLVEVGNLAVAAPGGGRWLITALTAYLHGAGAGCAVFTCGPALRNAFLRLGVELIDVGPADPGHLPAGEASRWGRYYEQAPRVTAARVAQSHRALSARSDTRSRLGALWQRAGQAGRIAA